MCAPTIPDISSGPRRSLSWEEIVAILRDMMRAVEAQRLAENAVAVIEEDAENAAVVPQAPVRSASGSLDGAPPPKRRRDGV